MRAVSLHRQWAARSTLFGATKLPVQAEHKGPEPQDSTDTTNWNWPFTCAWVTNWPCRIRETRAAEATARQQKRSDNALNISTLERNGWLVEEGTAFLWSLTQPCFFYCGTEFV